MPRGSLVTSARAPGRVSARAHDPGTRADKVRYVSEMFTCIVRQYGLMTFGMHSASDQVAHEAAKAIAGRCHLVAIRWGDSGRFCGFRG
jgi:hypothetical protein